MITHTTSDGTIKKVALTVQDDEIKCSDIQDLVTGAADGDRLRGVRQASGFSLYTQVRSDAIVRRIFSRRQIDGERAVVKRALLDAASNLTPERLKRMGSPGRLAVQRLRQRAARPGRHDIKAGHIFSDIRLLASGGRKRSFLNSPVKPGKTSHVLKTGAAALVATHDAHRIKLQHFCANVEVKENLSRLLLATPDENSESVLCCIAIFRTLAINFLVEEKKPDYADQSKLFEHLRTSMKSDLLHLFIDRWRMARKNGLIREDSFEWVAAVDRLVDGLKPEQQTLARHTRKPRNVRSPASPHAPTPPSPQFSPLTIRNKNHPTSLQQGRQAASLAMPGLPDSPSRPVLVPRNGRTSRPAHVPGKKPAPVAHKINPTIVRSEDDLPLVVRRPKKATGGTGRHETPVIAKAQPTLLDMLYLVSIGKSLSQTVITVDVMPLAVGEGEKGPAET